MGVVAAYLICTIIAIIYVAACPIIYCKAWVVLPVLPWAALSEEAVKANLFLYMSLVVLNSCIFYFLGVGIKKLVDYFRKKKF